MLNKFQVGIIDNFNELTVCFRTPWIVVPLFWLVTSILFIINLYCGVIIVSPCISIQVIIIPLSRWFYFILICYYCIFLLLHFIISPLFIRFLCIAHLFLVWSCSRIGFVLMRLKSKTRQHPNIHSILTLFRHWIFFFFMFPKGNITSIQLRFKSISYFLFLFLLHILSFTFHLLNLLIISVMT